MSTAVQPAFTVEFAATHRDMLLGRIEKERATTKRVIGNIPNDKRDYKPHPISRTAWELANHLVVSDIWFLNGIASRNFEFTGEPPAPADTVAGLVEWYEREAKQAAARIRKMSAEELLTPVNFFWIHE